MKFLGLTIEKAQKHQHEWSDWYLARQKLIGTFGVSEDDVNERMCKTCHMRQRRYLSAFLTIE